jgi:ribosomal protein L2
MARMARMNSIVYTVGDVVKHRGAFLRSAGWYTAVPRNGKVVAVKPLPSGTVILDVEWSDGYGLGSINALNVMPAHRADHN